MLTNVSPFQMLHEIDKLVVAVRDGGDVSARMRRIHELLGVPYGSVKAVHGIEISVDERVPVGVGILVRDDESVSEIVDHLVRSPESLRERMITLLPMSGDAP